VGVVFFVKKKVSIFFKKSEWGWGQIPQINEAVGHFSFKTKELKFEVVYSSNF
jgi:hypothetical protein